MALWGLFTPDMCGSAGALLAVAVAAVIAGVMDSFSPLVHSFYRCV